MNRLYPTSMLMLALCAFGCTSAPRHDSTIANWQVMVAHPGKNTMLCYAGAAPQSSSGSFTRREGKPYLMATRRPSGKIEISASAGYSFLPGSKVELMVDGESHTMFFRQDIAWAGSDAEDKAIIDAMKTASNVRVMGVSGERLTTTDYYSADGFAAAVARIRELCP